MKVLQVNCAYRKGSTGKITYDIHTELIRRGVDSAVCYGRGETVREPNVYKTCGEWYSKLNHLWSRVSGMMYGGCFFSTNRLISMIKNVRPDIVHLQCINGYFVNIYRLIRWLKKHHQKTVLTLHAEFMYTANCGHSFECERWKNGCGSCPHLREETKSWFFDGTHKSWLNMKEAFAGFDELLVVSVSPWLMERAKQSPILGDKPHAVVLNGLDASVFHPYETSDLRERYGLWNRKIVFHATPDFNGSIHHIKGGYYIIELAKRMPDVQFVVAGPFREEIRVPDNLLLLGKIADQRELARWYSLADVTVIASKRETFSMIVAESLCCGTPVVGFQAGGPESIGIKEYCEFVEYGDLDALQKAVTSSLTNDCDDIRSIGDRAMSVYSISNTVSDYMICYQRLMEGNT